VARFTRVPLEPGPLDDLMEALHQLHLAAGYPSSRDLERDLGGRDAFSHAAIHKAFTGSKPPTWRLVEPVVRAMARRANRDGQAEVERFRELWAKAAHQGNTPIAPETDGPMTSTESQIVSNGFSRPISDLLADALDEIEAVGTKDAKLTFRIPTGFDDLDALIGGWSEGNLIVVGGRPSSGKPNLLLDFCRAASVRYRLPAIDSLQWMGEGEAPRQTVETSLRRLKRLAETAKISIIVSAHAGKLAGSPMEAFTDSAAIELISDVAVLLERPDQDERATPRAGEADLIVAKNRNGPTATVTVACQLWYCRFVTIAPDGYVFAPVREPSAPQAGN
jgi:replicative DNA helicase